MVAKIHAFEVAYVLLFCYDFLTVAVQNQWSGAQTPGRMHALSGLELARSPGRRMPSGGAGWTNTLSNVCNYHAGTSPTSIGSNFATNNSLKISRTTMPDVKLCQESIQHGFIAQILISDLSRQTENT